jgi:type VI secretion system protein ImpE
MSAALSALKSGQLGQALQLLQQEVRQRPDDPKLRVFLFQLLAVLGQWERALTQLAVAGELDAGALAMVHVYREAIRCERWREEAFAGKRAPLLFGAPEPWMALLIEALARDAAGEAKEAAALRASALEQAPASAGSIGDEPFAWLADADPRFGPMLELFANGQYYWVPLQHVSQLRLDAPADLRDQVWLPATLTLTNEGQLVGLMPARYPGSAASGDDALMLGRRTDWLEQGGVQVGLGQRLLATDAADYPLLETRVAVFS